MARRSEAGRIREAITAAGVAGLTFKQLQDQLQLKESCVRKHVRTLLAEGWLAEDWTEQPKVGRPARLLVDSRFR